MEPNYQSLVVNGIVALKDIKIHGMKMSSAVAKRTSKEEMKNPELTKVEIKSSIKTKSSLWNNSSLNLQDSDQE